MAAIIKNTLYIAIGFIPGAGPFLAMAFTMGWTALTDPDSFFDDLKMLAPGIGIVDHIIQELRKSAQDTKAFIPEEWAALGRAIQGQIGEGNGGEQKRVISLEEI